MVVLELWICSCRLIFDNSEISVCHLQSIHILHGYFNALITLAFSSQTCPWHDLVCMSKRTHVMIYKCMQFVFHSCMTSCRHVWECHCFQGFCLHLQHCLPAVSVCISISTSQLVSTGVCTYTNIYNHIYIIVNDNNVKDDMKTIDLSMSSLLEWNWKFPYLKWLD